MKSAPAVALSKEDINVFTLPTSIQNEENVIFMLFLIQGR